MNKLWLYVFIIPAVTYVVSALNIEQYFKKGKALEIRLFYMFITFIISYLLVGFIFDITFNLQY